MITRTFKLCLNAGTGSAPFINVSQTDKDEVWLFELYTETGERYIPSSGAIIGIKADGHGIANTGTVDSEGRVVITETEQMTASAGRAIFELSIDGLTHGTANFIVNVEKKPIDGAIMSDSDLSLISQAVDSAAVIVDVIGDSDPSEVIGEHVDAWLDNHPEATTTVLDGAITAPKINSTLWDKLLVSEEASGAVASFDDGADDVPVSSLKVALEPVQLGSGDPSPSNVRPIIAANGKNLLDASTVQIGKAWNTNANNDRAVVYIPCKPNTMYAFSINDRSAFSALTWVEKESASATTSTYLTTFNGKTINLTTKSTSNVIVIQFSKTGIFASDFEGLQMQMELGSSVSPYQPYQGIMVERTKKNLFDIADIIPQTHYNTDGVLEAQQYRCSTPLIPISGSLALKWSTNLTTVNAIVVQFDSNRQMLLREIPTATNNGFVYILLSACRYVGISFYPSAGNINTEGGLYDVLVAEGTDNTYEPYIGTSYPVPLGQDVYGGTVDLATGVLTVDRAIKTVKWSAFGSKTTLGNFVRGLSNLTDRAVYPPTADKPQICDVAPYKVAYSEDSLHFYVNATTINMFLPVDTDGDTDISVCYELATPQTIQLTPTQVKTLLGYNNISSTGTVDVIYHADTKLYVDKMTTVDNAVIAPTEETFTATRNYTVNDLVIVNDTLYKVTANIASGSAITPNSNVQQTTLGALIKALS